MSESVYEYSHGSFAVEYMIKGETFWRRTMAQPLDMMKAQEAILWENPAMAATRMVYVSTAVRLLSPAEIEEVNKH